MSHNRFAIFVATDLYLYPQKGSKKHKMRTRQIATKLSKLAGYWFPSKAVGI